MNSEFLLYILLHQTHVNLWCSPTKEGVGGSVSVFMFHLLLPRLLRLLANVDGQPRAYDPVHGIQRENITQCPQMDEALL